MKAGHYVKMLVEASKAKMHAEKSHQEQRPGYRCPAIDKTKFGANIPAEVCELLVDAFESHG